MNKRKNLKAEAEKYHAMRRARERYGLVLTHEDYVYLCNCIGKQDQGRRDPVRLVQKQSNRVSVWDIILQRATLRVAYDKVRGRIITFLPPGADPSEKFGGECFA